MQHLTQTGSSTNGGNSSANDATGSNNNNPDGLSGDSPNTINDDSTPAFTILFTEPSSQQVFTNIPSTITIQGSVANALSNIASVTVNGVAVRC